MTEQEFRSKIVEEALTWQLTPFIDKGQVKGVGADCATFPQAVLIACGRIPQEQLPDYGYMWFGNQESPEFYLDYFAKYGAVEVAEPKTGDLVVYKYGYKYAHAGIVLEWPEIIHCSRKAKMVTRADGLIEGELMTAVRKHEYKFFSFYQ